MAIELGRPKNLPRYGYDLWRSTRGEQKSRALQIVELKGEELWAMWEENLEHTFSRDPYRQTGGYVKRAAGQNLYFKIENPAGQRVQELFAGGQPVRPE